MKNFGASAVCLLLILIAAAGAAAPATRPSVPPLIIGAAPPKSFVVDGILRFPGTGGLAFHVATDGQRRLCAVYDPADGTPLFLSDGQQTLVYDLANDRVVRVPSSRGNVHFDWNPSKEKPLNFGLSVQHNSDPTKLEEHNTFFRVDKVIADTAGKRRSASRDAGVERFVIDRSDGQRDTLEVKHDDPSWFRFVSTKGTQAPSIELTAAHIDQPVPDSALAFPDPKRMAASARVTELEEGALPLFLVFLRDGRAWMAKMVLCGGPISRQDAETFMPNANWDELRERDRTFGAAYRAALAEQGLRLPVYPPPTLQPAQ